MSKRLLNFLENSCKRFLVFGDDTLGREKKLSIIDIAELSGVSTATVSRVLNRNGRYSPETEKKVMDIVKQYDYKVNQNAKSLRTNKTQSIGVIVPDITNEFFSKIIRAIETNIVPKGYTVFVCDSDEKAEMEDFHISSLVSKDVDGIIYISTKSDVKRIYENYKIPVVYIDRRPQNAGTLIISDNEMGGYLATEELIKQGCKKIMMLRDEKMFSTVCSRYEGFLKAHQKYGVPVCKELIADTQVSYTAAKELVKSMIVENIEFDGIFANNDIMAIGALHALREMNIKVPEQVKIVGFDGISLTEICDPPMTTVKQSTDKFGEKSVEALLSLIKNKKMVSDEYIIPVELIVRSTT